MQDTESTGEAFTPEMAFDGIEAKRPRVWTVWIALLAIAIAMLIVQAVLFAGIFVYYSMDGKEIEEIEPLVMGSLSTPPIFILMLFCGPGVFGFGAIVAAFFSPEPFRERLGFLPVQVSRAIYPLAIVGSFLPMAVGFALAGLFMQMLPESMIDKSFAKMFDHLTPLWSIPFVIVVGLIPGFCEEMLFRGYVQRRFIRRYRPVWGITLSSILFGLAHVIPSTVIFATLIGFYLGILAWKTGSIWPSIFCHLFINSGLNLWRVVVKFAEIPDWTRTICEGVGLGISALCFVATLWLLFRRQTPLPQKIAHSENNYQTTGTQVRIPSSLN